MWFYKEQVKCFSRDTSDTSDFFEEVREMVEIEARLMEKLDVKCDPPMDYSRVTELVEKAGKDW